MITNYSKEDKTLTLKLTEEIDQHTADNIRRKMDDEIKVFIPRKVIFDFSNISFMDSSGIGMVIGRYKLTKMLGGNLEIININKQTKKIFDMSGVTRIIKVSENQKEKNIKEYLMDNIESEEENNEGIV